jgi:hypothetical protein
MRDKTQTRAMERMKAGFICLFLDLGNRDMIGYLEAEYSPVISGIKAHQ